MTAEAANKLSKARSAAIATFEDNVGVRIVRLAEVFSRLAKIGVEGPWNLRATELRILNILDGVESVPINEISRKSHVDKAWISRSVRELEDKGLVARRPDERDSRKSHALLTAEGRALLDQIRPDVLSAEGRVLKGIEERQFKQDLDRLIANAEDMLDAAEKNQVNG